MINTSSHLGLIRGDIDVTPSAQSGTPGAVSMAQTIPDEVGNFHNVPLPHKCCMLDLCRAWMCCLVLACRGLGMRYTPFLGGDVEAIS
jgi:hypothetical protein